MKNRILDYLNASQEGEASTVSDLSSRAQDEIAERFKQLESYLKENPAVGIGAAFGFGLFLGWLMKRR